MSAVRPYWLRHPIQLRIVAAVVLVALPVMLPIIAAITYRREIAAEVAAQYRLTFHALIKGTNA
jgi:hypothetical protein